MILLYVILHKLHIFSCCIYTLALLSRTHSKFLYIYYHYATIYSLVFDIELEVISLSRSFHVRLEKIQSCRLAVRKNYMLWNATKLFNVIYVFIWYGCVIIQNLTQKICYFGSCDMLMNAWKTKKNPQNTNAYLSLETCHQRIKTSNTFLSSE